MRGAIVAACAAAGVLAGCSIFEGEGPRAVAKLEAAKGNALWGSVSFAEQGEHVVVRADVRNLRPGGEFGFHLHEKGDCSAPDFMSAGGHFNPGGKPHAHFGSPERHAGDLRNLRADAEGNATYTFSARIKTSGLSNGLTVYLIQRNASGAGIQTGLQSTTGTSNWTTKNLAITTRPDTVEGYLKVYIASGYGTAWLDDIQLTGVFGTNVPLAFGGSVIFGCSVASISGVG